MNESKYEGRTKAEWLALSKKKEPNQFGVPTREEIHEALEYFRKLEADERHQTEERRFQTQIDESRNQAAKSRKISWSAIAVSVVSVLVAGGSLVVAILALVRSSQPRQPLLPLAQPAPIIASPMTNASPATTATPAAPKP
jgi:hypothetical protein